jgi:biopolymer transport protein ExbB
MNAVSSVQQALLKAGAAWVLWFLGLLSVASVAVFLERLFYLRGRKGNLQALAHDLAAHLRVGDISGAMTALQKSRSVAAAVACAGLELAPRGPAAADNAMLSATSLQRAQLERRIAFLGTLGNNAPFVGLFGTVVGIVHAFAVLGQGNGGMGTTGAGTQGLMTAIGEALVTTAIGIAVALPAVAANNYLQRWVAALLAESEALHYLVLAYLSDRNAPSPVAPGLANNRAARNLSLATEG